MKPITLIVLLAIALCGYSQQANYGKNMFVEGEVSGVWDADTVFVTGEIYLPADKSLAVMPGVYVEFQGYFGLNVLGDLEAIGAEDDPIVFSVQDTTGLHNIMEPYGAWRGIFIYGADPRKGEKKAIFEHCHFEYAKAPYSEFIHNGGAVHILGMGNHQVLHCTFFRNYCYMKGAGLYFENSSPVVLHNRFVENYAGHPPTAEETYGYGGGLFGLRSKGTVMFNEFEGNWASGLGGGLSVDSCDVLIANNIFRYNDAPLGGGMGILRSSFSQPVSNNLFLGNTSMFFGGGLSLNSSRLDVVNNTFVNNHAGQGGGLYVNYAFAQLHNNLFWGNTASSSWVDSQVMIWDSLSQIDFYFCNIEFGAEGIGGSGVTGDYVECIDSDPRFLADGDHPYQLHEDSPCVMAGNPESDIFGLPAQDLAGNERFRNGRIDIGAYEFQDEIVSAEDLQASNGKNMLEIFPNPVGPQTRAVITMQQGAEIQLWITDAMGRSLGFKNMWLEPGIHGFYLSTLFPHLDSVKHGSYLVSVHSGQKMETVLIQLMNR